jgi:hypothetical protein
MELTRGRCLCEQIRFEYAGHRLLLKPIDIRWKFIYMSPVLSVPIVASQRFIHIVLKNFLGL